MSDKERTTNAEARLASCFAKYEPAPAKLGKALRTKLRARLPGLSEIVYLYERQESLVISYSPTENGYEGVVTLSLQPDVVKLFFSGGPQLSKADPKKLLQGSGAKVRYVVLEKAADLDRPEIEALMEFALELARVRPAAGTQGALIVRAEEQKQRATRAKQAGTSKRGRAKPKR